MGRLGPDADLQYICQRRLVVNGIAQAIEDSTEQRFADLDTEWPTSGFDQVAELDAVETTERHARELSLIHICSGLQSKHVGLAIDCVPGSDYLRLK